MPNILGVRIGKRPYILQALEKKNDGSPCGFVSTEGLYALVKTMRTVRVLLYKFIDENLPNREIGLFSLPKTEK